MIDELQPPPERWEAAGAARPPAACGGDGAELWRVARALLLPRAAPERGGDGAARMAREHAGAHALLRAARTWRLRLVALPLQLLCLGASYSLWGLAGSLVTHVLCTFCPTLLAHSPLVTPDLTCAAAAPPPPGLEPSSLGPAGGRAPSARAARRPDTL